MNSLNTENSANSTKAMMCPFEDACYCTCLHKILIWLAHCTSTEAILGSNPFGYSLFVFKFNEFIENLLWKTRGVRPCIYISKPLECSRIVHERASFIEHNRRFAQDYPEFHSRRRRWKSIFIAISVNISSPPLYSGKKWDDYWPHMNNCSRDKSVILVHP